MLASRIVSWTAPISLGAVMFLGACGRGGAAEEPGLIDGEAGVRAVASALTAGLAAGDGPRVCSLLDPPSQGALAEETGTADCLAAVKAWAGRHPGVSVPAADAISVTVSGTRGRAALPPGMPIPALAKEGSLTLEVIDSRWTVVRP